MLLRNWLSTLAVFILISNMERISFNYSLKNTPVPPPPFYKLRLTEKIESVIKRMSWKAHSFKEDENQNTKTEKENYGFKTRKYPPQCKEIGNFEKDPMNIVRNIKFQENTDEFQRKRKKDIEKIKSSPKVFVPAQKLATCTN